MELTARKLAARKFPIQFLCDFANAVLDGYTGELLEYRHLITRPKYREVWGKSFGDEVGRLAQGTPGRVEGTNTLFFIHKHEVPPDRRKDVTYDRICCNVRPEKDDPNRVRLTVGGNLINYPGQLKTQTANLTTAKIMWNSVLSTPNAEYACADCGTSTLQRLCNTTSICT